MKHASWIVGLLVVFGAGCVEPMPRYRVREVQAGGLTTDEVVRMSKAGLSDSVIVEKLKADGITARPSSEQIVSLKKEGVSDAVVEAMMSARVAPESKTVEYVYYPSDYYYPYYPYSWGYPYYYSGYWGYYPYGHWGYYGGYYPYHSHYHSPASYSSPHPRYR